MRLDLDNRHTVSGTCALPALYLKAAAYSAKVRRFIRLMLPLQMYIASMDYTLSFFARTFTPRANTRQSSQVKSQNSYQGNRPGFGTSTSSNSFTKSFGPGRAAPDKSAPALPRPNGRPAHARSKSQAARPRTAHGHRYEEDEPEPAANGNGTINASQFTQSLPPTSMLQPKKVRAQHPNRIPTAILTRTRESSLCLKFRQLDINEQRAGYEGQVTSRPPSSASLRDSVMSDMTNVTSRRPERSNKKGEESQPSSAASQRA
jgi:hypothetical protein